jgi:alkylation response protein AidB-like acyl-CoA dehydrogenase
MGHYKSNLRDIEFNLFEVFDAGAVLGEGPFAQLDTDSARDVLTEVERLASEDLAASFTDSDRNPPVFDPATGLVAMPKSFLKSYSAYAAGGWDKLDLPESLGGIGAPPSLRWAAHEMTLGANPPSTCSPPARASRRSCTATARRAEALRRAGHRAAVGRDHGAHRAGRRLRRRRSATTAELQPDGTWHLRGVKRFITSAEWDWPENIFHLVLARPVGIEGVGGPGTKGCRCSSSPSTTSTWRPERSASATASRSPASRRRWA